MGSDTQPPSSDGTSARAAYSIVDVNVTDPVAFERYIKGHWETVQKYGGRFLVADGGFEIIEGEWTPKKIVIHQWPSAEAFHRWHLSEDYRPWKELRMQAARANVVLVEGLADAGESGGQVP